MSKEITFMDRTSANEYKRQMEREGYKMSSPREANGGIVVSILSEKNAREVDQEKSLREALSDRNERLEAIRVASGGKSSGQKFVGAVSRGLGDVAKSLSTNENKRRMRIAQMPGRKAPIAAEVNHSNPISGRSAGMRRHNISNAPKEKLT